MTAVLGIISAAVLAAGELGGYVVDDESGRPLDGEVSIVLHADAATVAGTAVKPNGMFLLQAPPGDYWAQVLAAGEEIHAEKVSVPAGSALRGIRVSSPYTPDWLGVGGSGLAGEDGRPLEHLGQPTWLDRLLGDERRPSPLLNAP